MKPTGMFRTAGLVLTLLVPQTIVAQEAEVDWPQRFIQSFKERSPITDFPVGMEWSTAYGYQAKLVDLLKPELGRIVGYKAALTGAGQRKGFNVTEPVWGVLLEKTLTNEGTPISSDFGVAPFIEGDFIMRVGSADINDARDRMAVLAALDAVVPFIELVDLPVRSSTGPNMAGLIAGNTGARKGLLGQPVIIEANEDWMQRLAQVEVSLYEDDQLVSRGTTVDLYNHPVEAVIWLRDALARQGIALKAGDLLSLGTVAGGMKKMKPGTNLRADYKGLVEGEIISVSGRIE